jgi:hypothetical protein
MSYWSIALRTRRRPTFPGSMLSVARLASHQLDGSRVKPIDAKTAYLSEYNSMARSPLKSEFGRLNSRLLVALRRLCKDHGLERKAEKRCAFSVRPQN